MTVAESAQFPRPRRPEPVLITEAEVSQSEQAAHRRRRYALTMGIRVVCLVFAAVFYKIVWLMIILAVLGAVLPWIAVLMANDRPPKKRINPNRYEARPDRVLESRPVRVIDG
jgi:Flp pilus assembly protein TadB